MPRAATVVTVLVLASIGGAVALVRSLDDAHAPPEPPGPRASSAARARTVAPTPRRTPAQRAARPVVLPDADLRAAWDAALVVFRAGRAVDALVALAPHRRASPAFFAEKERAALLARMEAAGLAALSRAARSSDLAGAQALADTLRGVLLDPARLAQIDALLAAAERRDVADGIEIGADIVARVKDPKERAALEAHLRRFAGRGAAPKKPDWIDTRIADVERANAEIAEEPVPLPLPDEEDAEKRRLDQLEKLRQRGAIGLLGSIDGALAWLALHQEADGRFGADATLLRCKSMNHDPPCVAAGSRESYPLAATGLATLAFLDFRDQDVRRLFEPTLARAVAWLRAQQQPDGSFRGGGRSGYAAGIGLMALAQAAAASGDADLREAVEKGLAFHTRHQGPLGGFRYSLDQPADLSVTGWYVQAVEAARHANAAVPKELVDGLDRFVSYAWRGEDRFSYLANENPRPTLSAVGMLSLAILREDAVATSGAVWRTSLRAAPPNRGGAYALYYGVRVLLLLDGTLPDAWRKELTTLTTSQRATGSAAGMIPLDKDSWFGRVGATAATAFAALTLEHALYRR